jgi:hypothetical protein
MDAGTKKAWKLHQLISEIQTWSAYLEQSAETFEAELEQRNTLKVFSTTPEKQVFKEVMQTLRELHTKSRLLRSRARRLHNPER